MTFPACPRLFEVEALRDGRLAGAGRASFERHLASCATCAREAEALDALGCALRAGAPGDVDELQVRRERVRLLAAFDRSQTRQRGRWLGPRALVAFSVAVLVAISFALVHVAPRTDGITASGAVVQAEAKARWSRRTDAGRELVVLEHGSLRIRVQQAPGARSFAVMLPDGELEDIGTTFSVTVTGGRTERVHVDEGTVLLRLRGRAPIVLEAGQAWHASPTSPLPRTRSSDEPVELSEPARPARPTPARETMSRPPAAASQVATVPGSAPLASPSAATPMDQLGPDASAEFRTALAALNTGQSRSAAQQFRRFAEKYPSDPRAEDAAYLRVLALERAGDASGRRAAARAYLRRYPSGFRRAEVEGLAR